MTCSIYMDVIEKKTYFTITYCCLSLIELFDSIAERKEKGMQAI